MIFDLTRFTYFFRQFLLAKIAITATFYTFRMYAEGSFRQTHLDYLLFEKRVISTALALLFTLVDSVVYPIHPVRPEIGLTVLIE